MRKKRLLKSAIAMLALVAMLMENTYSVTATVISEGATWQGDTMIEGPSGDGVIIDDTAVDNGNVLINDDSNDVILDNDIDTSKEINISVGEEDIIVGETILEPSSEKAFSDRIEIEKQKEITLYVNTDQMNDKDSFTLNIEGNESLTYDAVLKSVMKKVNGGVYYINGLANIKTVIKAAQLSAGMSAVYTIRKDGNPQVALISSDSPVARKTLYVDGNGNAVKGLGYDEITLAMDGSALPKNTYYNVYVKTKADVLCAGKNIKNGVVSSLSPATSNLRLSNLNNEAFTIYIEGENENVLAAYTVGSVENGTVRVVVKKSDNGSVLLQEEDKEEVEETEKDDEDLSTASDSEEDEEEALKRTYEYEDEKVSIIVTLNNPSDLPDEAKLHADEITMSGNEKLFREVNETISKENTDDSISLVNLYVYDVYFTVEGEEVEPLNPVSVNISYKKKNGNPSNDSIEEIKTFHLKENENGDISSVENVTEKVVTDNKGEVEEVTVSLDSFSLIVTGEYTSNSTLLSDGGSYSLGYILANYNSFIKNGFEHHNHFIGPVAVGGDADINSWGNESAMYDANSYIKGKLTQDNWWATVGGGALYLGSENSGVYTYHEDRDAYTNSNGTGINNTKGIYITDNYIDFDTAFSSVNAEISSITYDFTIDKSATTGDYYYTEVDWEGKDILYLRSGYTYHISDIDNVKKIRIFGADISSAVDTILVVDSSNPISQFPKVEVVDSEVTTTEYGQNSSIVFVLPNTTSISMRSDSHYGHIVAPKAKVSFPGGGSYNGCVIADSFYSNSAEGHMWPYNGKKFEGASTGFKIKKTVNGNTPSSGQIFEFVLEEYKNGVWTEIQSTQNNGELASFDTIAYSQADEGSHYYRIREVGNSEGYEYDTVVYLVKVDITNEVSYIFINQNKTESFYKVSELSLTETPENVCTSENEVTEMSFDNKEIAKLGSISLLKKLNPSDSVVKTFYVTLQNGDGEYYNEEDGSFVDEYSEIVVKAGVSKNITDLPFGDYVLTEVKSKAIDDYGHEYETVYTVDGVSKTCSVGDEDQSIALTVDSEEAVNAVITNKMLGQIKVTKSYIDAQNNAINDGTVFYVVLSAASESNKIVYYDLNGGEHSDKQVIPVKAGETVIYSGIPVPRSYTVTETDAKGNTLGEGLDYDVVDGTQTIVLSDSSVNELNKEAIITNRKHEKGKINILKKDAVDKSFIDGAVFYLKDKNSDTLINVTGVAGAYNYSDEQTGISKLETKDGSLYVDGLPYGRYSLEEVIYPAGYEESEIVMEFTVSSEGLKSVSVSNSGLIGTEMNPGSYEGTYTVYNKRVKGSIKLIKSDSKNSKRLSGAVFELYKDGMRYPDANTVYTTDANGELSGDELDGLDWGTYYFLEKEAPVGYELPEGEAAKTREIVIDSSNCTGTVTVEAVNDKIYGELLLHKVDTDNKPLNGASFKLYSVDGSDNKAVTTKGAAGVYEYDLSGEVQELFTDESGNLSVKGLPYGSYRIIEEQAPFGYNKDENPLSFTIGAKGQIAEYSFTNTLVKANVEFIKIDDEDEAVEGVTFILYKSIDGKFVKQNTYISGENGHVLAEGLGEGTYYFTEEEVKGYEVNKDSYGFTITAEDNGKTLTLPGIEKKADGLAAIVNTPLKGKAELFKYVLEDGVKVPLEGAEFDLYKDDKKFKSGLVSDDNGVISVDELEWGTYYFIETKAAEGFLMDENPVKFIIDAENLSFVNESRLELANTPIKGYVELVKVDKNDDETKLNGVEFDLYRVIDKGLDSQKAEVIGHYTTVNGMIAKDTIGALEYGDYYFLETKTVPGYELNETPYEFSISKQDELLTITAENIRQLGKVTFEKYNSDRSKKLDGAVYELYSTNAEGILQRISAIFGNDYHKLGEYTTKDGGQIVVENLAWGNYYFVEKTAPVGYVADTETKISFTINESSLDVSLTGEKGAIDKEENGAIKLIKSDGEGNVLAGAKFELYRNDERYPDSETVYVTDENGEIKIDEVPYGKYYFVEIGAPEGYVLPDPESAKSGLVTINENNTKSSIEFNVIEITDEKIFGALELLKVDGEGNELSGATFYLVKVEDGSERNVKTDGSAGVYNYDKTAGFLSIKQILETNGASLKVTGLPYGTYRIYEEKAPEGYNKVDTPFEFIIDSQGKTEEYRFENSLIQAGVEFMKADADGNPLAGAVFELFKVKEGNEVSLGTVTSAKDGKVEKSGLSAGDYYFKEISAPVGYEASTKLYTFKITATDNDKVVTIDNADMEQDGLAVVVNTPKKGSAKLKKVVKGTNNGLKGALFDLYKKGDSAPIRKDIESDDNGYVKAADLEWGSYYFKETKAPAGYVLDEESIYAFEINAGNVSEEISTDIKGNELKADNELILGQAMLVKKDSVTKDPISGAVFALYNAKDDSVVAGYEKITSDVNGSIQTGKDLEAGSYYFKEVSPAEGYEINNEKYSFSIDQSNMDKVVKAGSNGEALNVPRKGKAGLFKYTETEDGLKQTGLAGAEFTLYKEETILGIRYDKEYGVYTTGADGMITVEDLLWGNYTFKETKAPSGYELNDTEISFTISATQLDYTGDYKLSFENERYNGAVKLVKSYAVNGETKGELEGAAFRFYSISDTQVIEIKNSTADGTYITDKNGEITISGLAWGSYYFE
nr:choice-of-anchor A family protein [Lachnospiraceae bacterium]